MVLRTTGKCGFVLCSLSTHVPFTKMNTKSLFYYRLHLKHSGDNSIFKHQVNDEQNSSTILVEPGRRKGVRIHSKTAVNVINVKWWLLCSLPALEFTSSTYICLSPKFFCFVWSQCRISYLHLEFTTVFASLSSVYSFCSNGSLNSA